MLRTAAAVSATALLAGAALTSTAGPASARVGAADTVAPKIVSTTIDATQVVVPAKGWSDKVRFSVRATDNVGVGVVMVGLFQKGAIVRLGDGTAVIFPLHLSSGTAQDGVWSSWIRQDATDLPGNYTLRAIAVDKAENSSEIAKVGTYQSRYNTRFNFAVADKTVAQGETVALSGALRRVGPAGWQAFGGQRVLVQFRAAGTDVWKRVGKAKTRLDGTFVGAFTATQAGSWRVVYLGDTTEAPAVSVGRKVTVG